MRRTLLFFGLVRPYKGLDLLLSALPADVRLIVAGEFWTPVAEIQALITELGLTDRVELRTGYVAASELPALFAEADAVVLPYRSGTASIVTDVAHENGIPRRRHEKWARWPTRRGTGWTVSSYPPKMFRRWPRRWPRSMTA